MKEKNNRLYNCSLPIVALTGSIATGKSTVKDIFKNLGRDIIDADQLVKEIYTFPHVKNQISSINPKYIDGNNIEFEILRTDFFNDAELRKKVEDIIFNEIPSLFLKKVKKSQSPFVIYDIPLLYEKDLLKEVDFIILSHCTSDQQIERLISRDKISEDLAIKMINSQLPIDKKKDKADFIIDNSKDKKDLYPQVEKVLEILKEKF